jgi:SAM-dependent methyltransferase
MFFQKIYGSWKQIQIRKYEYIVKIIGKEFFHGLILDIGIGPCYFEEFIKNKINANIVGIDTDKITLIKNKTKISKIAANGNFLPFKKNTFDTIISFDTIHLIKNNDFRNVLKNNGYVLFSIFFNEENKMERRKLLKEKLNGFKIIKKFEILGKENEYVMVARNQK